MASGRRAVRAAVMAGTVVATEAIMETARGTSDWINLVRGTVRVRLSFFWCFLFSTCVSLRTLTRVLLLLLLLLLSGVQTTGGVLAGAVFGAGVGKMLHGAVVCGGLTFCLAPMHLYVKRQVADMAAQHLEQAAHDDVDAGHVHNDVDVEDVPPPPPPPPAEAAEAADGSDSKPKP